MREFNIQFRVGKELKQRIQQQALTSNLNLGEWMIAAIFERFKQNCENSKYKTSAHELMANRQKVSFWVSRNLRDQIDKETKTTTRTTWLIDACLAKLERDEDERLS